MNLDGTHWRTPPTFDNGEALWEAVCEHELEGVVAKAVVRPLPAWRARLGQDLEPRLLALSKWNGKARARTFGNGQFV